MAEEPAPRLDRAALERVIRRAAELHTAERDPGETLTPDDVLALGREVGIPARYLWQALLEERSRPAAAVRPGLWDRIAGPALVSTYRVVRGEVAELERILLRWVEQHELLCVQRQQPGRITWEPLSGIQAAIRRSTAALGGGRRPFMLSRIETLSAMLEPLEADYCQVALSAALGRTRGEYLGGAATFTLAGAAATVILLALGAVVPVALLPLPAGLGMGYGALRRFRAIPERVRLGLERILDHLERGAFRPAPEIPARRPGLLELLAEEVRKSLRA